MGMVMSEDTAQRIAIVTVHGTGDTAQGPDGEKWFQRGSVFADRLLKRLASHGVVADIVPHLWSGANSAKGREQGAEKLARAVKQHAKSYAGVHIVGHSHGGNVANDAASMISWRRRKQKHYKVDSITTVGTPFFKSELSLSESIGGIAFLLISIVSVITLVLLTIALFFLMTEAAKTQPETFQEVTRQLQQEGAQLSPAQIAERVDALMKERDRAAEGTGVTLGLIAISIVPLFFIFPIAFQGLRRILRLRAKRNGDAALFSLWHTNDEAIAFLQRVEKLPIQPFPKGSLWRGSRTSGIVWGVRAIILFILGGLVAYGVSFASADTTIPWQGDNGQPMAVPLRDFAGWVILGGLLGAPLIFTVAYALARLFGGLLPEWAFRGYLNGTIGGIVKGMAFGQDGDERIGNVATMSHAFGTREHILQGDVAARMQHAAAESAAKLIERYRWSLFTVGPDTNASLEALATDAMTWDSLIHTTYFDQPEVADIIADYIADEAKKARGG